MPVYDRPAIQIVAEEAVRAGLARIVLVEGPGKSAIEPLFHRRGDLEAFLRTKGRDDLLRLLETPLYEADVRRAVQDSPRGLGHAILCAREAVGEEPFAVFLPDDLIIPPPGDRTAIEQCLATRAARGGSVVALQRFPKEEISAYGVIAGEEVEPGVWRIRDLVEKPAPAEAPSEYAVVGRYVLEPRIFAILERTPPGHGGEVQVTDALRVLAREAPVWGCVFRGRRYDIGTPAGLLEASTAWAARR